MIYILLAEGFEEIEALTPADMLRRAGLDVCLLSVGGTATVTGAHGITVTADCTPDTLPEGSRTELVLLPGGMPGAKNLDASPVTDRLLAMAARDGGRLAAICAAPLVLGRRNLLQGRRAVCYPGFEKELRGALLCRERVVTDGNITTAVGMGAALEFAGELVRLLCGPQTAHALFQGVLEKA